MIFGKTRLELKVGIFVFMGLVILSVFILRIGKFKTFASGYPVNFIFHFVNGVKVGAPVRFSGVDVGEVKAIKIVHSPEGKGTEVRLISWVRNDVKIPADSSVWVNTLGLLGEKYVEIMPGKDYSNILPANQALTGVDPIPMHEVTKLAKDIVADLDESIVRIKNKEGTLGKLLYDDAIYKELEALITDVRKHPWKLFWKTKEKK